MKSRDARERVERIAKKLGLPGSFPAEVKQEAERLVAAPAVDDPALADLTDLPFVTIDDSGTRDLDQALFIEEDGDGYRVWYAIADASHFVQPGTALFGEALRRGASYYLPGYVIPMLPRSLSEGIVSLNAGVTRRALVFDMRVGRDGSTIGTELVRARVRSCGKLAFGEVQAFLDGEAPCPVPDNPRAARSLTLLRDVGEARMRDARERGVVRYRRTELEVEMGDSGHGFVAVAGLRLPVERYNEQISLLCNVEGAHFLKRGDRPNDPFEPIYRVHDPPAPERYDELEALLRELVSQHDLPEDRWLWSRKSDRSLADFLAGLPEGRLARAVHRQAILMNGRSSFSVAPGVHFGVGADVYARFSAPMREIVGVFVHKEALEKLSGRGRTDGDLVEAVVQSANRAKELQKRLDNQANRLVLDPILRAHRRSREPLAATVMGITDQKLHVQLDEPPIDVKVYLRDLARQAGADVEPAAAGTELRRADNGKRLCRLGDGVRLRVTGRDRRRDRWTLALDH